MMGSTVCVAGKNDTILDEQFCQVYYTLPKGDCSELRSRVRSEVRGNGTPTLELGDKDKQPAMVFLHGWPDTSALWANQFAEFCGEDKEYFCVAPSWIDYHPDYPPADASKLFYSSQREDFRAVIEELGLSDITFVIFDFGAIIGYQMLSLFPELFGKVIAMDIPMTLTFGKESKSVPVPYEGMTKDLMTYQQKNIEAFLKDDNEVMMSNLNKRIYMSPCIHCEIAPRVTTQASAPHSASGVGARTGWPYYNIVRMDKPWTSDGFDVPVEKWEFSGAPTFPKGVPILYIWNSEVFQSPSWFKWIEERGDGSEHVKPPEMTDHWMQVRQPEFVNGKMKEWLATTSGSPDRRQNSDREL